MGPGSGPPVLQGRECRPRRRGGEVGRPGPSPSPSALGPGPAFPSPTGCRRALPCPHFSPRPPFLLLPLSLPPSPGPFLSSCAPARPPMRPPPGTQLTRRAAPRAQDPGPGSPPDGDDNPTPTPRLPEGALLWLGSQLSLSSGRLPGLRSSSCSVLFLSTFQNPLPVALSIHFSFISSSPLPSSPRCLQLPPFPFSPAFSLSLLAASGILQGLAPGRPSGGPRTLPLNLGSRSAGAWELPVPNLPSAASPRARRGWGWGSQVPAWSLRPGRPPPTHLGAAWAQRPGGVSAAGGIKMTDAREEGKVFLCLKRPGLVERKS